jgi:ribosomal protein S3
MTIYGKIGIKVWVNKGDVLKEKAVLPKAPESTAKKPEQAVPVKETRLDEGIV